MVKSDTLTTSLLFLVGATYSSTIGFGVTGTNGRTGSWTKRQADVRSCLNGLNATFPGDPAYATLSLTYNARTECAPVAIVLPYVTFYYFPALFRNRVPVNNPSPNDNTDN